MPGRQRIARRDEPRVSKEGLPSTMLDEIRRIETACRYHKGRQDLRSDGEGTRVRHKSLIKDTEHTRTEDPKLLHYSSTTESNLGHIHECNRLRSGNFFPSMHASCME